MGSILDSIKKLLLLSEDDTSFDTDIIIHINTVLAILTQLGVGPESGFSITDRSATWDQFMGNNPNLDSVISFVYLKVKLVFDPPANSAVLESLNRTVGELEWRINAAAEESQKNAETSG